ncbi:hypothetical protein T310_0626 [Rasamsonia emersonii CBS 393.64]|uniref:Uncharacterized protein n=1 Tax=Rasamsonia emersonii (strain ATCC 16479 / CBS 393.64 / IMI 116815) TaxID=1408163 RepID=A0A0F4Z454_RASE3|nr:hypothetical protein T310_0626 [Rasamsonia emersonii CBS 393.64]KKA25309.1 hypothetical protein T310_0626 [Rasamsonia emersonii CBS 393.64]
MGAPPDVETGNHPGRLRTIRRNRNRRLACFQKKYLVCHDIPAKPTSAAVVVATIQAWRSGFKLLHIRATVSFPAGPIVQPPNPVMRSFHSDARSMLQDVQLIINYSHAVKTRGARGGSSLPLHAAKTSFSNVDDPCAWPTSNMLVYSYSDTIGKELVELASIHASSDSMLHSHVRTSNGNASTKGHMANDDGAPDALCKDPRPPRTHAAGQLIRSLLPQFIRQLQQHVVGRLETPFVLALFGEPNTLSEDQRLDAREKLFIRSGPFGGPEKICDALLDKQLELRRVAFTISQTQATDGVDFPHGRGKRFPVKTRVDEDGLHFLCE